MKRRLCGFALMLLICLPAASWAQRKRERNVRRTDALPARAVNAQVEPPRTMRGSMLANVITARASDSDQPSFDYTITSAHVSEGKLELRGTIKPVGASAGQTSTATATLVGTLAKHRPPRPDAAQATDKSAPPAAASASGQTPVQQQGRETTNPENTAQLGQLSQATQTTARTTHPPTAPGGKQPAGTALTEQITEAPVQTRALAAATGGVTGCEVMFLKLRLPTQLASHARAADQTVQLGVVLALLDNQVGTEINQHMCRVVRALDSQAGGAEAEESLKQLNRLLGGTR